MLLIWWILTRGETPIVTSGILPSPYKVLVAFGDLYRDNGLLQNTTLSIALNLAGYIEAILIAIPLGFLIGLIPFFKGMFQRGVDAFRYVPLTAVIGLFIVWFGTGTAMKVHFLAFGILIYLLPVVMVRVFEVQDVYLKTVYTLGASSWQTIKTVYFPAVISKLSEDIRVLTAISWTYIIVAEGIGSQGGVGDLIWRAGMRQGRFDKVFAVLFVIMLIGMLQDRVFGYLDRIFLPHKYQVKDRHKVGTNKKPGIIQALVSYAVQSLTWIFCLIYLLLFANEFFNFMNLDIMDYLFGDAGWAVHLIMLIILYYQGRKLYNLFIQK